jgi:hypothetical protein
MRRTERKVSEIILLADNHVKSKIRKEIIILDYSIKKNKSLKSKSTIALSRKTTKPNKLNRN